MQNITTKQGICENVWWEFQCIFLIAGFLKMLVFLWSMCLWTQWYDDIRPNV